MASGVVKPEPGKARLLDTRRQILRGWSEIADDLVVQDQVQLAIALRRFVKDMPPVRTEREWILFRMRNKIHYPAREITPPERSRDPPSRGITR